MASLFALGVSANDEAKAFRIANRKKATANTPSRRHSEYPGSIHENFAPTGLELRSANPSEISP